MQVVERGGPGEGTTDSWWGRAEVLVKHNGDHPNVVVNEFVCNRLALLLGLPATLGDIWIDEDGVKHWVCAAVRSNGTELPPASPDELLRVDSELRANVVVFDIWVHNTDRSEENLLSDRKGGIWLIDHEQALFGDIQEDRARGISSTRERKNGFSVLLEDAPPPRDAISKAASKLRYTVDNRAVKAVSGDARRRGLVNAAEERAMVDFLLHRRDHMTRLLDGTGSMPRLSPVPGTLDFSQAGGQA
ncbi:HipA family kinase [Nocardiopsis synnemataformans]|uniref:HipA family kinase n=1 Tax=Nocardiopsis synnemataformans TaxID=61305 RepID=UPI003EB9E8FC